jgi:hypothetical protein
MPAPCLSGPWPQPKALGSRASAQPYPETRDCAPAGIPPGSMACPQCADSAYAADGVTAADRTDLMESSVNGTRVAATAERPLRRGNGTQATPARSSHDFDVAGTASRCCWRTHAATRAPPLHTPASTNAGHAALTARVSQVATSTTRPGSARRRSDRKAPAPLQSARSRCAARRDRDACGARKGVSTLVACEGPRRREGRRSEESPSQLPR